MNVKNVFFILPLLLLLILTNRCRKEEVRGISPAVVSTFPISNATLVPINTRISSSFSLAMDSSTIDKTNFTVITGSTVVSGTIIYAGKTATFIPSTNLSPNTVYQATLSTGVYAKTGEPLRKNYSWSFTTGESSDIVIPTITMVDPVNHATGVAINHAILATFSKLMDAASFTTLSFTLKQGSSFVAGTVTYQGFVATFLPTTNLQPYTVYSASITTAVLDMTGNTLASTFIFDFTTGAAPDIILPMVESTVPLNDDTEIGNMIVIASTFSETMDPATINNSTFTVKQGGDSVDGLVKYSGKTATFTPNYPLLSGAAYTATISTGAKDLAGNALAGPISWSFITQSTK